MFGKILGPFTAPMSFEVAVGILYGKILVKVWNMIPVLKTWSL
jgi:hypothetical protein